MTTYIDDNDDNTFEDNDNEEDACLLKRCG